MSSEPALTRDDEEPLPWELPEETELFRGDLQDVGLNSLAQLAQAEALSGWIRVDGRGEVTLVRGRLTGAACGALRGVEALRELMFLREGRYVVLRGRPPAGEPLAGVVHASMDAYRLREEWSRLAGQALRRVDPRWRPSGHPVDRLVAALDGRRGLAELVAELGVAVTVILDPLLDALERGLVERAPPPVVAPEPNEPEHLGDLVDRARELARAGQLDAAERALQRALAQRPDDRVIQQNLKALARRRSSAGGVHS